jgi:glucose-6-phosphate 1-epimerase
MTIRLSAGATGLSKLLLARDGAGEAELYLHGAHVTSWTPAGGTEVLWVSREAQYGRGAAIRGGIPVIFPQFAGLGPLPKHGFARTQPWKLAEAPAGPAPADATRAWLELRDSTATGLVWPHAFLARVAVELAPGSLTVRLAVTNPGREPWAFTAALHTYLRVADVREAALVGLRGVRYRSTLEGADDREDPAPELRVAGEVDRIYVDAPPALRLEDRAGGRTIGIRSEGFRDVVVWNPWADRARALPDMGDDEYLQMLCVEAAQVGTPVTLAPGESWTGAQRLEV